MVQQKFLEKAEILIEALPYIQRFNKKVIVIKYGGSVMENRDLEKSIIEDTVLLKLMTRRWRRASAWRAARATCSTS